MAGQELDRSTDAAPTISILIVNQNAALYLDKCIRSIIETLGDILAELIVIDGRSTDNSLEVVHELWPAAKITTIPGDLGYVRGNNVGLRQARGRYTMLLNSDTVILPGAFQELIRFLDAHPEVGIASGAILNPDGSDQGVIRQFPSFMNGIFGRRSWLSRIFPNNRWYRRYMQSRREQGTDPFEAEIMSACSLVFRTNLVRELGGLDERFHFYWVDAELCSRVARKGFKIYCVPSARIIHYEGKGGSTSTFAKRLKMNVAFNHDAYLAYVEYHQMGRCDPRRAIAKVILMTRTLLLIATLILRPSRATSSGGAN